MGRACDMHGEEFMHTGFGWENLKEGDPLEDQDLDGSVILKRKLNKQDGRTWAGFIWHKDKWQAVFNTIMNVQVPEDAGNIVTA